MTFENDRSHENAGIKEGIDGSFTVTDSGTLEALEAREFDQKVSTQTLLIKNLNQYIFNPDVPQELQKKLIDIVELHQEILTGEESLEYKKALHLVTKNKLTRAYEELGLNIMDTIYTKN